MENLHNGKSKFYTHQWIKYYFLNLLLYLKIRTFYRTNNGSQLFILCLIIGKLNEISKILMVRAHIDKVKSPAFHFHTERSRNPQHF